MSRTVGENQKIYERYGIKGSVHISETEQLCQVIVVIEKEVSRYKKSSDNYKRIAERFTSIIRCNQCGSLTSSMYTCINCEKDPDMEKS